MVENDCDGMNKTYLLTFGAFFMVGFIGYSYKNTILASLGSLNVITQPLQSAFTQIQNAWGNIPEPWRGYLNLSVIGGVPAALMMFFAWTKTRAMNKLQQIKNQAQSLVSEKIAVEQESQQKDATIMDLTQRLETAEQQNQSFTGLTRETEQLKEANKTLETRVRDYGTALKAIRSPSTAEMKRRLEQEGFLVHEKVS